MASKVAKACSSTSTQMPVLTIQEKGTRNKRKYRADPPLASPNTIVPLPETESPSFNISSDQFESLTSHDHQSGCDMCCLNLGLPPPGTSQVGPSQPREELETSPGDFHDADWSDLTESQLQELLLSNLDSIFKSAIKKIVSNGYSEEVANKAILRASLWYGCKDMVSNIVENTLALLNSGQEIESSREHRFEDLKQMEKYVLAELVCLLREIRPLFSTGDAMWCLLICDMNVSHACAMDSESLGSFFSSESSSGNSNVSGQENSSSSDPNTMSPCPPNGSLLTYARRSETSNVTPFVSKHKFKPEDRTNPQASPSTFVSAKPFNAVGLSHSHPSPQEKIASSSRKSIGITKRDYILRQKSLHFEKYHHRTHGSKGTSRPGKLGNFGGLVLDKKLKALSDSTCLNTKNQPNEVTNVTANGVSPEPTLSIPSSSPSAPVHPVPSLPAADTELSLSFPSKTFNNPMPISFNTGTATNFSSSTSSTAASKEKSTWGPHSRHEVLGKLASRAQELQGQLQEWTEWTNQKVTQALRRLSKDKEELRAFRLEREEAERLRKEQQTSEEGNLKKLAEIENALRKAGGQVQRARVAVRRREIENGSLRRELEAAVAHAAEAAVACDESVKREKAVVASLRDSEKQKVDFQEELAAERRRALSLQQALQRAKDSRDRAEGKLRQEEEANGELLRQVSAVRKERERIEATAKSKEDSVRTRAETNLQVHREDIMKLEKEISRMRLKKDSSKIAALKRGIDGSYSSKIQETRNGSSTVSCKMTEMPPEGGVRRDRECVMCLSEEMSVVFLPCGHQVVCGACNDLHEKRGMKDCPSCRAPIGRRLAVRYSR